MIAGAPLALPVGPPYAVATTTASCPAGTVAISGGESFSDPSNSFVVQAFQAGQAGSAPTGWTATGATVAAGATMTVYAICISAG